MLPGGAIYGEDEFDARLLFGNEARSRGVRETPVSYDRRVSYLYETVDITRARAHVRRLQELYDGRCARNR